MARIRKNFWNCFFNAIISGFKHVDLGMRHFYLILLCFVLIFCFGCSDNKEESPKANGQSALETDSFDQLLEVKPIPIAPEDQEKASKAPEGMVFINLKQ